MGTVQIVFNGCDEYVFAGDCREAVAPQWPVQDEGGRWYDEEFVGQVAVFTSRAVHFGFMAKEVDGPFEEDDVSFFFIADRWFRPVEERVHPHRRKDMRYQVIEGSGTGHCCFGATVVDTSRPNTVCECFSMKDAQLICDALNAKERL